MNESLQHRASSRRLRSVLMFFAFLLVTALGSSAIQWSIERAEIGRKFPPLLLATTFKLQIANMPVVVPEGQRRIGFLGDSTVQGYPIGLDVATQLKKILEARAPGGYTVRTLAYPGMGPLEYYALSDILLERRWDQIIISFNLSSLSPTARDFWARREVVGWLSPWRLAEAADLPLLWWGIGFDRLLLYMSLVQSDQVDRWAAYRRQQMRAGDLIDVARRRLQGDGLTWGSGLPSLPLPYHPTEANRFVEPAVRQNLGDALNKTDLDHPVLVMLGATIDSLQSRGIEVLLYVTPTNVEHQERIGIDTRGELGNTIESLRRLAENHGASFLDLHRIFPDTAFRDSGNHLQYEGKFVWPRVLAARIADEFAPPVPPRTRRVRPR